MSTRSSIYCENGIHIFREVLSDDICLEVDDMFFEDNKTNATKWNDKYNCFTMPENAWIEMAEAIIKKLKSKK